jgi:GT2 family glycosyltransferase
LVELTIIVPFYQGHNTLRKLIETLPSYFPIMVIDDISDPPLQREEWMPENVQVFRLHKKRYFSGAVNAGITACKTDVLVLNQDTYFDNQDWVNLIEEFRGRHAMIGERISGDHPSYGKLGYIHGTFMYVRRDAIEKVGLLNEKLYPLWGSTAEYQWRVARAGFEVMPVNQVPGFHHERARGQKFGESITQLLWQEPENKKKLIQTPPLVSVIVPCYNYGRYLNDCLASLIGGESSLGHMPGQTIQSMEIIIVDDASTDGETPQIVHQANDLAKGIFSYHNHRNLGTAETVNVGIRKAQGKYITFLSADDMREPDSIEKLIEACENNPHSFAYDDIWLFGQGQRVRQWPMADYDFNRLLYKNHVHAGILFPKVAWEEAGGYPAIMRDGREDWAFNVALGLKGWCGVHVNNYGYLYRREQQGRSETNSTDKHREGFLEKLKGLFPDAYKGNLPMACCGKKGPTQVNNSAKQMNMSVRTMSAKGAIPMPNVGSEGMVKLEFLGTGMAASWTGPVTNARYRFGEDRTIGWVDKRDVDGMLQLKDRKGNILFRRAEIASKKEAKKTEEMKSVEETQIEETVEETVEEVTEEPTTTGVIDLTPKIAEEKSGVVFPDPADMTANEIKTLQLTPEQWTALYRSELAGKNRKGVITFIEEKLANG